MAIKGVLTVKDEQGNEQDFLPDVAIDNVICPDGARLNTKLQGAMDLLWVNPNPTVAFAAQTVNIDLSGYGAIAIRYLKNRTSQNEVAGEFVHVIEGTYTSTTDAYGNYGGSSFGRIINAIDLTGVNFGDGYNQSGQTAADFMIPLKIYGIKFAPTYKTIQTDTAVNNYTTDEQVIGTWVDGKTLYRKVYTGTLTTGTSTIIENGFRTNHNVALVTKIYGSTTASNNQIEQATYFNSTSDYSRIAITADDKLSYLRGSTVPILPVKYIVFVEYTKNE